MLSLLKKQALIPLLVMLATYNPLVNANTTEKLLKLRPSLDTKYAERLSFYINLYAEKYDLPKDLHIAILFQESTFRLNATNGNDFGIGQINRRTAKYFCPDIPRLMTDLNYSVHCSAKVLHDFKKRYSKKEKYWWTRYNSSNKIYRERYRKLVERRLNVIR